MAAKVQVGIVGAGPAGLLLAQLLARRGIGSRVLERSSREHVEERIRAGVLESSTVDTLHAAGVGERLAREGVVHRGIELRFGGAAHRIDFEALVPGHNITVYGQREVVRDLIAARLGDAQAGPEHLSFEVSEVELAGLSSERPELSYRAAGERRSFVCDWVVGCDGHHGVSRRWLPPGSSRLFEREFPCAWLGVLAQVAPSTRELIYARHERGFALHSMRTPSLSRFYLQVAPDEDLASWSDERIWQELRVRLETVPGWRLEAGPILERGLAAMRSEVIEPMRHGRLLLAGDAAHIVPATGAKGLNLAVADVRLLSEALGAWYERGNCDLLDGYSAACLERVWRVQNFSSWMTRLLHTFASDDAFERRLQLAQLEQLAHCRAAATLLAENYVGVARS
ncbi:MAG TPA: 4-hydroxybenzoate 3-monooxygenase [Polyangiaceae bacterium]|nr:4-hydroxybenzoate 3-monooxygenase [Polyangiaceae bacterium]